MRSDKLSATPVLCSTIHASICFNHTLHKNTPRQMQQYLEDNSLPNLMTWTPPDSFRVLIYWVALKPQDPISNHQSVRTQRSSFQYARVGCSTVKAEVPFTTRLSCSPFPPAVGKVPFRLHLQQCWLLLVFLTPAAILTAVRWDGSCFHVRFSDG